MREKKNKNGMQISGSGKMSVIQADQKKQEGVNVISLLGNMFNLKSLWIYRRGARREARDRGVDLGLLACQSKL